MNRQFLPVFSVDWLGLFNKLKNVEGEYGILAPIYCSNSLLSKIRQTGKPFFIDSGVFKQQECPWYCKVECEFIHDRWVRELRLADETQLRQKIREYLDRCDKFSPDYVFASDIIGEPLLSLHLARLSWQEYWQKPRSYILMGVVQVGTVLYNWPEQPTPTSDAFLPHYATPKSFLTGLISAYRETGYQHIALGGLLKSDRSRSTGLKFGLSLKEFDELLAWSRPDFVLGGLALGRIDILKKHKVWADSTTWLWWDERYDRKTFENRDIFKEILQ